MAPKPSLLARIFLQEDLNFLITNRVPRRTATQLMGWFSRLESPLLTKLSLAVWRVFASDLDLSESATTRFNSLHEVFIRALKDGARPIDPSPDVFTSPCDAVVGAFGRVEGEQLIQAKGFPYSLGDLLHDPALVDRYRDHWFVTLRLRSSMYHRFHAPYGCRVRRVDYISGDTWNVNPIALRRVEKLFCKNERAVVDLELADPNLHLTLVPVAAILVAGIKLRCLDEVLDLSYQGATRLACDQTFSKGEELGHFQSGSTIIVFASGPLSLAKNVIEGTTIRVGQPLFTRNKET